MTFIPVVHRELLAESRRPFNYWLRLVGAGVVIMTLLFAWLHQGELRTGQGGMLFQELNSLLFLSIWVIVPLLTADCISRERREGTLGLLFLTPLTARSVVLAKSLIHGLRAMSLLLAVLPILAIPLLLGGLSGGDLVRTALLDLGAVLLALSAGLYASSLNREWSRAVALAIGLSAVFALVYLELHAFFVFGGWQRLEICWLSITGGNDGWQMPLQMGFGRALPARPAWLPPGTTWRAFAPPAPPSPQALVGFAGALFSLGLFVLVLVLAIVALRLRHHWQESPPSKRREWLLATFCTPRYWQTEFRQKMTWTLNRNPIGWLQQYSWSARLAKWGWCLGLVLFECFLLFYERWDRYMAWQFWPALFLIGCMAFSAANSFTRERQSGALELLLVTPLSVRQIVNGRLVGIWSQFLPSLLSWLLVWFLLDDRRFSPTGTAYLALFLGSFLSVAVVGLYFSLRRLPFLAAWMLTLLVSLVLPSLMTYAGQGIWFRFGFPFTFPSFVNPWGLILNDYLEYQLLLAFCAWQLLKRNLSRRLFVLT